uniref:Alpha-mannosidase n=1 Tax=Chloropicon primus TaxID=1764295 RepID=A0A7S2SZB3_9CHLO|mmetsp:Transcript_1403/g.4036  ORF Transcript_1403/g.4036 Transcript_1403/m.4036 type:complete len:1043 (+) Transcript_1403:112-3240(+)
MRYVRYTPSSPQTSFSLAFDSGINIKVRMLMMALVVLVLALVSVVSCDSQCYNTTPKNRESGVINVHLVCHTHDDVGWLKNVDEYFVGSQQNIYKAGVGYIIDSVVQNLQDNPDRKFVYVEMAFFSRWWNEASDAKREAARTLVKNKQLTFANGGWCMHDEAAAHFVGMVDQTTRGHRFLLDTFGYVPRTGWQLDPFGHSATQAYLFGHDLGFDAMVLGRSDHVDLEKRKLEKSMEMLWSPSPTFGKSKAILTQIRPDGNYQPPPCFCFDFNACACDPIQDDTSLEDYNVDQKVEEFVQQAILYNDTIRGDDIMFLMGSDFQWENANIWYKNLDKLIHYANKDPRVNVFYSSPEDYFAAKRASGVEFPTKSDDFFPYSDGWNGYWTGYFTSRPSQKRYAFLMTSYLQSARQIQYFMGSSLRESDVLDELENAVSIVLHHDAITGTAKQAVADDYAKRLYKGGEGAASLLNQGFKEIIDSKVRGRGGDDDGVIRPVEESSVNDGDVLQRAEGLDLDNDFVQCPLLNISTCAFTETSSRSKQNMQVVVYNNLAQARDDFVHLPIGKESSVAVFDGAMNPVASQITGLDPSVRPGSSEDVEDLGFAVQIPPKGLAVYYVLFQNIPQNATLAQRSKTRAVSPNEASIKISDGNIGLTFDGSSGLMRGMENQKYGIQMESSIDFLVYNSSNGQGQNSGAYIFRPEGTLPLLNRGDKLNLTVVEGPLFSEMRQTFAPWLHLSTRVYGNRDWAELMWRVGPIPFADNLGKEISMRVSSSVSSGDEFYTDSNGRDMLKRVVNYRPTWDLQVSEPVAGNYYPLTAALAIHDDKSEMAVLLDRACGGTSLNSGDLEFMVHRRILADDARGVGEALNETECGCRDCHCAGLRVAGTTGLVLASATDGPGLRRQVQARKESPLVTAFRAITSMDRVSPLSGIQGKFPDNVSVMTFHAQDAASILIRLAHMYQAMESSSHSRTAKVDLQSLLPGKQITEIHEKSLSANQDLGSITGTTVVSVDPMQIRTFVVKHKPASSSSSSSSSLAGGLAAAF